MSKLMHFIIHEQDMKYVEKQNVESRLEWIGIHQTCPLITTGKSKICNLMPCNQRVVSNHAKMLSSQFFQCNTLQQVYQAAYLL